jgi:phenylpropionate dioxygenase-like ring-hydroxylating dioxygenase large terminal subunit
MTFIKRLWYAAAWADELPAGKSLARTILGEPVLMWRSTAGALQALADQCPHRLAPLSKGKIEGNEVRCGYHGLRFDGSGRCVHNPHGPLLEALRVRAYPLLERHQMLWIWMGPHESTGAADPSTISDLSFIDRAQPTAISHGYLYSNAGHKLLEDNILDLSHADYLHPDTLGGGSITRSKAHLEERHNTLFVQWLAFNELAIPIFQPLMPTPDTLTDMWTEVLWHPNGVMALRAGATPTRGSREEGIDTWNAHIMTPETERSTHYFYVNSRNYKVDDGDYNAAMAAGLRHAFECEDKPMIEAQQDRLGGRELFDLQPRLMGIDAASTRARRIYDRLLAEEAATLPAPARSPPS